MKPESIYETKIKTISVRVKEPGAKLSVVKSPEEVVQFLKTIFNDLDSGQEHFIILTLNKANAVTGYKVCHSGGQNEALVDPAIVFRNALLLGASSVILAHNHPSGRTNPSREDIQLTQKLADGGRLLGIKILDHIIIGDGCEGYQSFSEKGLL